MYTQKPNQPNLENIMKQAETFTERLAQSLESYRKNNPYNIEK